ncbi:glutaredoxin 3 [Rhizobium sp. 2YAF20]|jgi:glutaredoxin 3|uniref:glutaredoxin 3 n=1 Tax=Rhizobium sp. 2YAF20 TaxID=3233027 RepID=UPI003F965949
MASVVIYTREFCGYCARAKSLLQSKGVDFVEHNATYSPDMRQEMIAKSNGGATFPQIFINEVHVGGCDDLHALDRAGRLDPMLSN